MLTVLFHNTNGTFSQNKHIKKTSAPSLIIGEDALVTYLEPWQFLSILIMLSSKSFFSNGLDL